MHCHKKRIYKYINNKKTTTATVSSQISPTTYSYLLEIRSIFHTAFHIFSVSRWLSTRDVNVNETYSS